jgi:hypothetical protein
MTKYLEPECCNADVPPTRQAVPEPTQCLLTFEIVKTNWFQKENWLRKRIKTLEPSPGIVFGGAGFDVPGPSHENYPQISPTRQNKWWARQARICGLPRQFPIAVGQAWENGGA